MRSNRLTQDPKEIEKRLEAAGIDKGDPVTEEIRKELMLVLGLPQWRFNRIERAWYRREDV